MQGPKRALSICLSISLTLSVVLDGCNKKTDQAPGSQGQAPATTYATPTPDQLYQLVAPIALFPDNLLAQVLAASTFPEQVTAAYNWTKQNPNLKGQQLMQTVDQQSWDASVKGLTQFPDVLNQMATNLSWTSALGDAYFNAPQDVMNAVQVMRQRAYQSGNLKSNQQQNVSVENQAPGAAPAPASSGEAQTTTVVQPPPQTIIIQPSQPEVVYVPTYNPTVVYGAPVATYPGYSTGDMVATGLISFGLGIAVGAAINGGGCCGWGYNSWGCGWNNSSVTYNRNVYVSNSNTFTNRNNYYNNNINRNNINTNDINRNNLNRNNINTNDINRNNLNRDNRANNFNNTARNNNMTTPHFNQKDNQPQFRNNQQNLAQNNRQQLGGTNQARPNQPVANQGRLNQQPAGTREAANRGGGNNFNQQQRDPARGYGQQPSRGTNTGAFSDYSAGGNTRTNSARGQQSLQGNRNPGGGGAARPAAQPASRPAPQASRPQQQQRPAGHRR